MLEAPILLKNTSETSLEKKSSQSMLRRIGFHHHVRNRTFRAKDTLL